jgi:hypothetical protein
METQLAGKKQPHLAIIVTSGLNTTFFRPQIARLFIEIGIEDTVERNLPIGARESV